MENQVRGSHFALRSSGKVAISVLPPIFSTATAPPSPSVPVGTRADHPFRRETGTSPLRMGIIRRAYQPGLPTGGPASGGKLTVFWISTVPGPKVIGQRTPGMAATSNNSVI